MFFNGYLFNRNLSSGSKTYWRCTWNGRSKCTARIVATRDGITVTKPLHNHDPSDMPLSKIKGKKERSYVAFEIEEVEEN